MLTSEGLVIDHDAVARALDSLDRNKTGASYNRVQEVARLSNARMTRAVTRLIKADVVKEVEVTTIIGNGGKRSCRGLRRVPEGS